VKRFLAAVAPLVLAIGLAACSTAAGTSSGATPAGTPAPGTVRIVARDTKFQAPSAPATAGTAFAIDFVNQDSFPHNVEVVDGSGTKVFGGDTISSSERTYQVPALTAGTYHIKCSVHPDMDGTLTVQ
jgi:plastocyanin